jgi:hypothetical protein
MFLTFIDLLFRIVHNDFHQTDSIFSLFDGLEAPCLNDTIAVDLNKVEHTPTTNGHTEKPIEKVFEKPAEKPAVNGTATPQTNGTALANAA